MNSNCSRRDPQALQSPMARRKSDRFKVLQRLADHREREAAQALGVAQQQLEQQRRQLQELEQYRREYTRQFYENGQAGMNGAAVQEFQDFLAQLDQIIEQQRQQVSLAAGESQQKKGHWQTRRTDAEIYDKVIARFRQYEQTQQRRQEQRAEDDRPVRDTSARED